MPEAIAMACTLYRMDPRSAPRGGDGNAAPGCWACDDRLGRIETGLRADLVVLDEPDVAMIPYRPGHIPSSPRSSAASVVRRV